MSESGITFFRHTKGEGVASIQLILTNKVEETDEASCENRLVLQELEGNDRSLGVLDFPEEEDGETDDTDDDHRDHRGVTPTILSLGRQRERKKDQGERERNQDETDNVEVDEAFPGTLSDCDLVKSSVELVLPLGLLLGPKKGDNNGSETDGDQDGEHAVTPSPVGQDTLSDLGRDEVVDDERSENHTRDETSESQGRAVGDDQLEHDLQTSVSELSQVMASERVQGLSVKRAPKWEQT